MENTASSEPLDKTKGLTVKLLQIWIMQQRLNDYNKQLTNRIWTLVSYRQQPIAISEVGITEKLHSPKPHAHLK